MNGLFGRGSCRREWLRTDVERSRTTRRHADGHVLERGVLQRVRTRLRVHDVSHGAVCCHGGSRDRQARVGRGSRLGRAGIRREHPDARTLTDGDEWRTDALWIRRGT